MKRLHAEGHKPEKIKELLQLGDIPKSTFYNCLKHGQSGESNHKVRNRTVDQMRFCCLFSIDHKSKTDKNFHSKLCC